MKSRFTKLFSLALIISLCMLLLTGCGEERKAAIEAFNTECERIQSETSELEELVSSCEELINAKAAPYDENTLSALETETTNARASLSDLPEQPTNTEEILTLVEELKSTSYVDQIDKLSTAKSDYETSVKIMEQITNPSEEFVIECLKQIEGISAYDAATEDNDPNGNLHKDGGYTSAVYFQYDKVDQSQTFGDTLIEKGTDAGGQIEVYATAEDAQKRCDYLSGFDGSILSSGSHKVIGTVLIRTSNLLTATEQTELEDALVSVFTTLK